MRRRSLAGVVALTVVGAAIRFSTLDRQSFWFDELVTVSLVRRTFGGMLSAIPHSEATPYAYYVAAWPWTHVFGHGEIGLRSLSALMGTATVPIVYGAGVALCSRRAGLIAAALVSVSPFLVWYSQEARSYSLLAFFAACTLLFFGRALREERGALAGWAVSSALALATHYFAVFLVAAEAAWLLLRFPRRRAELIAALVPTTVFLVQVPLMLKQRTSGEAVSRSSLGLRAAGIPKNLVVGYSFPAEVLGSAVAAVLLGVGFALVLGRTQGRVRAGALLAGGLAAVSLLVPYVLALADADFLSARNVVAAVVPGAVCVAGGYASTRLGLAAAAALCALFLAITLSVCLDSRYGRTDWRGVAERLGPAPTQRAIVVIPAISARLWNVYLPHLHELQRPTARVGEIDVVGLAIQGSFSTGALRPPPPKVRTPPDGFAFIGARQTATFTLIRYRARVPVVVSRSELVSLGLTAIPSDVLLQRP